MNISDVAKITGLTSKAIRFYEEKGLVTPPMRSENGYRTYTQQHLNELTLLRQARQVGFNLAESGELVNLFNDPQRHSADVKRRTLEKVAEIESYFRGVKVKRHSTAPEGHNHVPGSYRMKKSYAWESLIHDMLSFRERD